MFIMRQISRNTEKDRRARALKIAAYLKKTYPKPKSELTYHTPFQFLVSVILSAQCTDKVVNRVTEPLYTKYRAASDFAKAKPAVFQKEISSIPFFRNKTKAILGTAKIVTRDFKGRVPETATALIALPGIGYKTAHVILGEVYEG